ncbi:unnamed protein product [Meloidogyne enterolobii]|uniref:Uncharacterized protein n=1 Tax=Meloidogyne enterolobii TaxID=390850 RepID=A0ACB0YC64_MELEN
MNENQRNYNERIKEKSRQYFKIYYQKNKESIRKNQKTYNQNNKEKRIEYKRKYRQNKKNVQSDNNEGTSFVNPQTVDFTNIVKLSIVCEEEGNLLNQGEEEYNKGEDKQNQIEVEETNKIHEDDSNKVDCNKKIHPFDLNELPGDD